jgi:WD40-like Beta Propeller Repeat
MPNLPKLKLLPVVLALAAFLAVPAAAQATLAYTKGLENSRVYVARDNGSGARQIGPGRNAHVSPDGETVIYERETKSGEEMRLYSVSARKSERLLNPWAESFNFAWSPDSTQIAATTGPLNGPDTLLVINVQTTKRTKVATGFFNGVSFSPESNEIVYGMSAKQTYPLASDIYRYEIGGTASHRITNDHNSAYPLWGPNEEIVFVKQLGAKQRQYGPKNELYLMSPKGTKVKRLTRTVVSPLAVGLIPTAWSESGEQLLTEFGGQDIGYAVAVNPKTGAETPLTKDVEMGFVGTAISADGKTVLGTTGLSFGGNLHPKVVTVPYAGGPQKVLVKGGFEPSWGS